ncbi:DUF859 family phage minor structural protein [Faecalibaculum rodentium]|uniref:DUF859 family phage minor structural protein n=1 Tax=Faecalibaculum rodentium TaxID=1702221 RepID=UPI0023F3C8F0|nr:DUF859 family phage minor structural protein [Faecalibaculum rodentium]
MAYGPWKGQRWRTVWNNGYYRIDVKWDFCQDVENNKTKISMMGQRVASLNGYYSFNYTAVQTGVGDFNGTKFAEERNVSVGGGGTTVVDCADRHSEVPHNADGTWPSGHFWGWWRFNVPLAIHNVPTVGWTEFNIDGEIPTIPRATTPTLSASSVTCGSNLTINLPRHASGFTHRISYRIGGKGLGHITTNAGTSFAWTVPNLGSYMPNSTSVWVVLRVETMSGSTVIGYKDIGFTATAPTSWVPTATISSIAEATANLATQFGGYVQGKSTLRVKSAGSGSNGSSISSYVVTIQGRKYNGADITSAAISASGTVPVTLTVTDSRGRTASKTQNVTVLAYSPPQITVSSVARTSDEATTATCTYNFSIASVNGKNTKAFYIQYLNGSTWTDITRMSDVYTKSGSVTSGAVFGVDATTKVRFVAQDYFTSVVVEKEVGPTFTLMNLGAGGHSMAVGGLSSNDGYFECHLPMRVGGIRSYAQPGKLWFNDTSMGLGAFCRKVFETYGPSGGAFVPVHFKCPKAWSPTGTDIWMFGECSFQNDPYSTHCAENLLGRFWDGQGREWLGMWTKTKLDETANPWGYMKVTWTSAVLAFFPVGSVYLTYTNTNPGTIMGGTWVQFSQGRVLLGQGTGSDGSTSQTFDAGATGGRYTSDQINTTNSALSGFPSNGRNYADRCIVRKQAAGYNQERDAMISLVQPYQVIYAWRRTA